MECPETNLQMNFFLQSLEKVLLQSTSFTLREKCLYSELFCPYFPTRENTEQYNSEFFSRPVTSGKLSLCKKCPYSEFF